MGLNKCIAFGLESHDRDDLDSKTGAALATARAEEARCAASSLGIKDSILLGFPDGRLGDYVEDRTRGTRLSGARGVVHRELRRL